MDHTMAGIEDISGMMMGNYKIRDKWEVPNLNIQRKHQQPVAFSCFPRFRHFNNNYLKHWFLRDSNERGNSRKIFETYSRLNLQDAINIVNKTNVPNCNNNNPPAKSLSSLFRTFTESNLTNLTCPGGVGANLGPHQSNSNSLHPPTFTSIPLDSAPANAFNFDMANLNYSPCNRDMADAEIHHILTDNMFKPVKKVRFKLKLESLY